MYVAPCDDCDAAVPLVSALQHSLADLPPAAGGEGEDVPGGEIAADLLLHVLAEIWQQHLPSCHVSFSADNRTTNIRRKSAAGQTKVRATLRCCPWFFCSLNENFFHFWKSLNEKVIKIFIRNFVSQKHEKRYKITIDRENILKLNICTVVLCDVTVVLCGLCLYLFPIRDLNVLSG